MSEYENNLQVDQVLGGRYRVVADGTPLDVGKEYKAYDTQLDRLAVVTILNRRFGGDAEAVARLAKAQQKLADLNEPASPPIEEIGLVDDQVYLVRSPLDARPLGDLLAQFGSLDVKNVLRISLALCHALALMHQAGLVHGGLAPDSVLVSDDGGVTVIDTAVFPALLPETAASDQPWGRLPCVSPEQAAGHSVHAASDVYVVGLLMYEMLAGRPPFRGGDETMTALQHMRYDPPSLQVLVPDVPRSLAQIVHMALSKEPAARYRNAGQLGHILSVQLDLQTKPPQPVPLPGVVPGGPMVVPPPPAPSEGSYGGGEAGADWIMFALMGVALVAVLGLIPLWRTVYRRYAIPTPPPSSGSYYLAQPEVLWCLPDEQGQDWWIVEQMELGDDRFVCYNTVMPNAPLANDGFPGLGVQITDLRATWVKL